MLLPVLAALIALPSWQTSSTSYAAADSIASGTVPWNNAKGNGASTPFQMAAISSFFSGTLACPNMVQNVFNHGTPTLQIWLIEDSPHTGRLDASEETRCTQTQTPWSLSAGQNPAGRYHLFVSCHWGGCGHDVKVSYTVDPKTAAPAGNTLTADQLLNQTLKNQTPKPAQAYAVHTGWATSASPATNFFPSSNIQSKIAADALIACTNPAGTLRMSIKISPTSSLNPNKVLNSTTLSCQSGSGHTDDLSVHTNMGFIVTFDNAINTGNWAVKYVASADKPLPTPPSKPSCTNNPCHPNSSTDKSVPPPPCTNNTCHSGGTAGCPPGVTSNGGSGCFPNGSCTNGYVNGNGVYICLDASSNTSSKQQIQGTAAYKYCQDGVQHVYHRADCTQAFDTLSHALASCIDGYLYDKGEITPINSNEISYVHPDQQKAEEDAAAQVCHSVYL